MTARSGGVPSLVVPLLQPGSVDPPRVSTGHRACERGGPVRRDDTQDPLRRLYDTVRAGRADRVAAKTLQM